MDTNIDIPGYKIISAIGQGGMAQVYLAIQESIGRQVALKVMSEALSHDKVWAKRFLQEAQVIAQLSHPNIVPVFDVGEHNGKFFISMEHISGGSLKEKMQTGLAITSSLKIITGIAAGLDFAGEKGFVHRDIKPDNIMFRENGSPVILDFGIVKQKDTGGANMTQTGMIVGTTSYMSPEQAQAQTLDERSDIYSLGVVFYEMLTGAPPFKGESDIATLLSHVNEPPPPLPIYLSALQPVLNKSLAKNKEQRYTRGMDMIEHIESLEKSIKTMLKDLERLQANTNHSDATIVINQNSADQPTPSHIRTPAPTSKTEDDDLTLVLNSAKATIKDHSAESRAKKAKRTRNMMFAASFATLLALGYLGYHQLLILPEEKRLAEERIKASELKIQQKIANLLIKANRKRASLNLDQPNAIDELLANYFEVLKLDPENSKVKDSLNELGDQFINEAENAISRENLVSAETFQNYALQVTPSNPKIQALRDKIKSHRTQDLQQQIDDELKEQKITTLLNLAKSDLEKNNGFSVAAYTQLKQVLMLDKQNHKANQLYGQMQSSLEKNIAINIENGKYKKAKNQLVELENYYPSSTKFITLSKDLNQATSKAQRHSQLSLLSSKISQLKREKRTIVVNDELRSLYKGVLSLEKNNKNASQGLIDTSLFDLNIANISINDRDFLRAKEQIRIVKEMTPNIAELKDTQLKLAKALKSAEKSDQLIKNTENIIKTLSADDKPKRLRQARDAVMKVQEIDPKHPKLVETLSLLENTYITEISRALTEKNKKLSTEYFNDTKGVVWPSNRITELQLAQQNTNNEKNKPKRSFVGGF